MNSKQASQNVGNLYDDLLIANWFDKEWFENEFHIILTDFQYRQIVESYNDSGMSDHITQDIKEWVSDDDIIEKVLE